MYRVLVSQYHPHQAVLDRFFSLLLGYLVTWSQNKHQALEKDGTSMNLHSKYRAYRDTIYCTAHDAHDAHFPNVTRQ